MSCRLIPHDIRRRCVPVAIGLAWLVLALAPAARAQAPSGDGYVMPPASVQELFARDKNIATLDRLSPDGDHFLIPLENELSTLELMSQRTLRLGMLEITPATNREWHLSTDGNYGVEIYSLRDRRTRRVTLPDGIFVSDYVWSPDGRRLAFLAHLAGGTQVWTADAATGEAGPLSEAWVMATLAGTRGFRDQGGSKLLQWTPDGGVLTLLVPEDRGPEPAASDVPSGPIVRRTRDKATPTSTLRFLLRTPHDGALFKYYTTAQLARLDRGRAARPIGEPAMYTGVLAESQTAATSSASASSSRSPTSPATRASGASWRCSTRAAACCRRSAGRRCRRGSGAAGAARETTVPAR